MLQIIPSVVSSCKMILHFDSYITKGCRAEKLTFARLKSILPNGEQSDGGCPLQKISQEKQFIGIV